MTTTAQTSQENKGSLPVRALKTTWHFARFLLNPQRPDRFRLFLDYQKILFWLRVQPNRKKPLTLLGGLTVHYPSLWLLRHLYNEVVLEPTYHLDFPAPTPRIIDAGGNIGLTMLFYKYQFPRARIVSFEPDPRSFAMLKKNADANGFTDVETHNVALSDQEGTLTLYYDPTLEGDTTASISQEFRAHHGGADVKLAQETVPAVSLRPYLKEPVDLLKIDIEGSEGAVMRDIAPSLANVAEIQMEFHYDAKENRLQEMIELLEKAGHRYRIVTGGLENVEGSVAIIYTRYAGKK